jgi:glycerophosphoryl diester phosphodiesterase
MGHAPENTLSSIRKAIEIGAPCMEIDVYYVDGHLVVFHDDRLERTTDGTGYLCEQSFDYLRSLDAGQGQKIPTLEEVCAEINSKTCLNIELKGTDTAAPVAKLIAQLVDDGWDINRFLVSSFHHRELLEVKRLNRNIKVGALVKGIPVDDAKFAEELGAFSVHPSLEFVDQALVEDAHERGMKVYVYTVDHPEDLVRMQNMGVDGVFTGFPEIVLEHFSQCDTSMGWC